jgi:hypothetical protein
VGSFIQTNRDYPTNTLELYRHQQQKWLYRMQETFIQEEKKELVWVVPSKYIVSSEGVDQEAFFDPA